MVLNYQNADCSLRKNTVSLVIIFGTISFPICLGLGRYDRENGSFVSDFLDSARDAEKCPLCSRLTSPTLA